MLKSVYSRSIDASYIDGASYLVINAYFSTITNLFLENSYPSDTVCDIDKTGFALGTSLSRKVRINKEEVKGFKKISR